MEAIQSLYKLHDEVAEIVGNYNDALYCINGLLWEKSYIIRGLANNQFDLLKETFMSENVERQIAYLRDPNTVYDILKNYNFGRYYDTDEFRNPL